MLFTCIRCLQSFNAKPSKRQQFCSPTCYNTDRLARVTQPCKHCGQPFQARPYMGSKYCSKTCSGMSQRLRRTIHCEHCGKTFERPPSWKNAHFCSYSCRAYARSVGRTIGVKALERATPRTHYERPYYQKQASRTRKRDNYTCQQCQRVFAKGEKGLEVHHILPVRSGGKDHLSNLVALCLKCHRRTDNAIRRAERES